MHRQTFTQNFNFEAEQGLEIRIYAKSLSCFMPGCRPNQTARTTNHSHEGHRLFKEEGFGASTEESGFQSDGRRARLEPLQLPLRSLTGRRGE